MSNTPANKGGAGRLSRRDFLVGGAAAGAGMLFAGASGTEANATSATSAATASASEGPLEVVGHSPLLNRGMNSALALYGDYAYVGSRTDGTHPEAGVLVLDISEPSNMEVVGRIAAEYEANAGETSRELRVWPRMQLLLVLNFACDPDLHDCAEPEEEVQPTIRFYDISHGNAASPRLVSTYRPSREPHEFYFWEDPEREGRALLFMSTPSTEEDNLLVTDISGAREGSFEEIASWSADIPDNGEDNRLHSLSVSPDGERGYLAYLGGGFLMLDTSELASGESNPRVRLLTPVENRPRWGDPGAHSAVPLPGGDYALTTDEVYGKFFGLLEEHGCPWGWTRIISTSEPQKPEVVSEYKVEPYNTEDYCESVSPVEDNLRSFSSHNPTLTESLAFITWHSAGLQVVSVRNPHKPGQVAVFEPEPLKYVETEDPALGLGNHDKVIMWSYPIIYGGLIYVVDVRNGLYALRYRGPHAAEVSRTDFLEGNSNLGDALRLGKGGESR